MLNIMQHLLDFIVTPAYAQAGVQQPFSIGSFLPLIVIFGIFYFLLIRPQQKKAKEHKQMLSALEEGVEVITAGGVIGTIKGIDAHWVKLEVFEDNHIKVQRSSIGAVMPKGTSKSIKL
jgi:preprotein translocase subunit YajC